MTREPIYAALFAKLFALQTNGTVVTCSRRLRHWADCDGAMQPAIYMTQGDQVGDHQIKGSPYKWDLSVSIYVYVRVGENESPSPAINPILDAIENALVPKLLGTNQTLGGLCDTCYIDGTIQTFEGTLGEQEVAIIPIKILVR